MGTNFLETIDHIAVYLICICIPGILFTLNGIHVIRKKETISIGTDSHFHWKKPVLLTGQAATNAGGCWIIFGVALLILGLVVIIGSLQ